MDTDKEILECPDCGVRLIGDVQYDGFGIYRCSRCAKRVRALERAKTPKQGLGVYVTTLGLGACLFLFVWLCVGAAREARKVMTADGCEPEITFEKREVLTQDMKAKSEPPFQEKSFIWGVECGALAVSALSKEEKGPIAIARIKTLAWEIWRGNTQVVVRVEAGSQTARTGGD